MNDGLAFLGRHLIMKVKPMQNASVKLMNPKDGSMDRVLTVFQLVQLNEPITLDQVTALCPYSRASIWRALSVLRKHELVYMRLGDNAYVINEHKFKNFRNLAHFLPNATSVSAKLKLISRELKVNTAISGFSHEDKFVLFESTCKEDYAADLKDDVSILTHHAALAAQVSIERTRLVRILRAFSEKCSGEDLARLNRGVHSQRLLAISDKGFEVSQNWSELSIPVAIQASVGFALTIKSKTDDPLEIDSVLSGLNHHFDDLLIRRQQP